MDAKEFATRMVTDDDFMIEMFKEMPDAGFAKDASQDDFAQGMAEVAAKRGWSFEPEELKEHYNKAIEGLGAMGAIKFIRRFSKNASAAGKSKKDLKARGVKA